MDINPLLIEVSKDGGSSNMGDVADLDNIVAVFELLDTMYALAFIRIHFATITGATGTAELAIKIRSRLGTSHDVTLFTLDGDSAPGIGNDVNFRIPPEEIAHWSLQPGDKIILEWANPDPDDITWGAEVGLLPIQAV